jgi:hypothetical protein
MPRVVEVSAVNEASLLIMLIPDITIRHLIAVPNALPVLARRFVREWNILDIHN